MNLRNEMTGFGVGDLKRPPEPSGHQLEETMREHVQFPVTVRRRTFLDCLAFLVALSAIIGVSSASMAVRVARAQPAPAVAQH